ncbi:MAG: right-handed parallel beta-helix repeat-containing protein, partial [Acidobacteriaceae bacterium]|nr:right-handed parallel beta-helix repeat-containing protein [Acidobacteriaceae bacterium]
MKVLGVITTMLALALSVAAQTVVVGTGNPDVDVPAVQAAVDGGGEVLLRGHFSFDRPPTIPTALDGLPPAMVLVSRTVSISGGPEATIEAGTCPFYIEAPGASVTIKNLRFIHPTSDAILVYAVAGLTIASCKIEGLMPAGGSGSGIALLTIDAIPTPTQPGHPENISGRLVIANNDMDLAGGTPSDIALGIVIFSVGVSPDREVDIYISGNHIRNVTEPAVNMRRVGGRAHVENNVLSTGPISVGAGEVIRVANIGSFVIAHNSIHCEWLNPGSVGVGVLSQVPEWPMEHAVVIDNEVIMSLPDGTEFTPFSAGIDIRGF